MTAKETAEDFLESHNAEVIEIYDRHRRDTEALMASIVADFPCLRGRMRLLDDAHEAQRTHTAVDYMALYIGENSENSENNA